MRLKVFQWAVVIMMFACTLNISGISDGREAQQMIFMLAIMGLMSLLVKNIWITLFMIWTIFLYSFFKFSSGANYLSNVFFGAMFYYMIKLSFNKDNARFFFDGFLWFVYVNISYMILQVSHLDFIYMDADRAHGVVEYTLNTKPFGLMGHISVMGTLLALAIPIMASRGTKSALFTAVLMIYPLYLCKTALCFVMGIFGLMFVLFYILKRKTWIALMVAGLIFGGAYVTKIDRFGTERFVQWHNVMMHYMIHPITGWGLDSFRNVTPNKDFRYMQMARNIDKYQAKDGTLYKNITAIDWWDNPHNLYISILYEFGIVGFVLFCGFVIQKVLRFLNTPKIKEVVGLMGFFVVFLGVSIGHFPIFLAKCTTFIIPAIALLEVFCD